jgi:hypothetical protein
VIPRVKEVLNGFLFQARDMVNAPDGLRKATKCIAGHTRKKNFENFLKIFEVLQIFSKYFFGTKYINLDLNGKC